MPFRFDPTSQKIAPDNATDTTQQDLAAHAPGAPKSSHGSLLPAPGSSNSKIPASKMDKSRRGNSLGQKLEQPEILPVLKRGLIFGVVGVLLFALIIYGLSRITVDQKDVDRITNSQSSPDITFPKGKKASPTALNQFLMKAGAKAVEDNNYQAAAHLYGHAAEEARLGGPSLNKQYIDALFAQAEVYQYNLAQPDKSRPLFEKILKAQQADASTKPIKLANTYNDLADSLTGDTDANRERIQSLYQKAISLAKSIGDNKGHFYYCYNAGDYYCEQGQYDKSLALAKESLGASTKWKDPELTDVADSHYLAARSLAHMPGAVHFEAANLEYEAALKTYEKAEAEESRYANCMRDAAWNKLRLGQRSEAQDLFDKASAHNDDEGETQSADGYMSDALK